MIPLSFPKVLLNLHTAAVNAKGPPCDRSLPTWCTQMANALMDGLLSFHLLKIGGLLVFDDNDKFPRVAAATSAFLEALGKERLEVILNTVKMKVSSNMQFMYSGRENVL